MLPATIFLWKIIGVMEILKMVISLDKADETKLNSDLTADFSGPLMCRHENHFLNLLGHGLLWIRIVVSKHCKNKLALYQDR